MRTDGMRTNEGYHTPTTSKVAKDIFVAPTKFRVKSLNPNCWNSLMTLWNLNVQTYNTDIARMICDKCIKFSISFLFCFPYSFGFSEFAFFNYCNCLLFMNCFTYWATKCWALTHLMTSIVLTAPQNLFQTELQDKLILASEPAHVKLNHWGQLRTTILESFDGTSSKYPTKKHGVRKTIVNLI